MLVSLNNFNRYPASPIPESLISGIPLFYLPPKSNRPVLASKTAADQSFALYWRQICLLGKTLPLATNKSLNDQPLLFFQT